MPTRYLTTRETSALVRKALKEQFPRTKFSVRGREYAGGASIDVTWTDGPNEPAVRRVVDQYRGADFDSSQDMKVYRDGPLAVTVGGELEQTSYGADFIHARREYSAPYGRWCSRLDLYQAPSLEEQARAMYGLLTATGSDGAGASFGYEQGNAIISAPGYDAGVSFGQWAPCLRAQGYTVETDEEHTDAGRLHTLAVYRPSRAT